MTITDRIIEFPFMLSDKPEKIKGCGGLRLHNNSIVLLSEGGSDGEST